MQKYKKFRKHVKKWNKNSRKQERKIHHKLKKFQDKFKSKSKKKSRYFLKNAAKICLKGKKIKEFNKIPEKALKNTNQIFREIPTYLFPTTVIAEILGHATTTFGIFLETTTLSEPLNDSIPISDHRYIVLVVDHNRLLLFSPSYHPHRKDKTKCN